MLKRVEPLEIPEKAPFKHDTLQRSTVAENLTTLCENARTPFVIALNGTWGSGKTTLLAMWEKQLKNASFTVIRFNAWENDFADDPGISVMGEIEAAVKENRIDLGKHPMAAKAWE